MVSKRKSEPSSTKGTKPNSAISLEHGPVKRRKTEKHKRKGDTRTHVSVPAGEISDVTASMDEDEEASLGPNVTFLRRLDPLALSLSKRELNRLHKLDKPKPVRKKVQIVKEDDDEEYWSSTLESLPGGDNAPGVDTDNVTSDEDVGSGDEDEEADFEKQSRPRPAVWEESKPTTTPRLPVKLSDGTVKQTGNRPAIARESSSEEEAPESEDEKLPIDWNANDHTNGGRDDIATGARFGRPGVIDILKQTSRKDRIQKAKEELATICQDIVGDPEINFGLLRRLQTFTLAEVSSPSHPEPIPNDPVIRKLALASQLAVFKDIIPGYRIRVVSEAEKEQRATQAVLRQREYEQALLVAYQEYLKTLEKALKEKGDLVDVALNSMCTLLRDLTHFNFRVNIMNSVVAYLSKRSWNSNSQMCLDTIITVFRGDNTGVPSLELVRILNRMTKERHYKVHPNVLLCLLHLRLKNELHGVRASQNQSTKEARAPKIKMTKKEKKAARPHQSKKARQTRKELKEIEEEMAEAEAEVDEEDRRTQHTETLKLLFVLYFSIIKNPKPTRLLSGALEGISRYAHLVNIDFFRDLTAVLKGLVLRHSNLDAGDGDEEGELPDDMVLRSRELLRRRLLCITTAFELLSGQGEAITIDLSDFITQLYAITLDLATVHDIEDNQTTVELDKASSGKGAAKLPSRNESKSISDLLFRTLYLIFNARASNTNTPPWRTAAFAKRLLVSCLSWPAPTVMRALEFVQVLLVKEPKLEGLLSTEDNTADGIYRGDIDDPQVCNAFASNFWELRWLERHHSDKQVRERAKQLANYKRP